MSDLTARDIIAATLRAAGLGELAIMEISAAILASLQARGLKVLGREPNEAQIMAIEDALRRDVPMSEYWLAAWDAAPPRTEGER